MCVCVCLYLGAIQHIRSARSTWWGLAFLRVVGELATDKPDTDRQTEVKTHTHALTHTVRHTHTHTHTCALTHTHTRVYICIFMIIFQVHTRRDGGIEATRSLEETVNLGDSSRTGTFLLIGGALPS